MLLYVLTLLGCGVFAASGALAAGRKKLDLLGVVVVAAVTAIGGGTLRDVLLDRPVFWIADVWLLVATIAATVVTMVYVRYGEPPRTALLVADALGLALFTIAGTQVAEQCGAPALVAVVMGAITGAAGGMLRDVLCGEVPLVLRRELYMTAAIAGSVAYLGLEAVGVGRTGAAVTGMVVVAALRLTAILFRLNMPTFYVPDREGT